MDRRRLRKTADGRQFYEVWHPDMGFPYPYYSASHNEDMEGTVTIRSLCLFPDNTPGRGVYIPWKRIRIGLGERD